jgi:molybdopterin/thiamine biosynthesis adenylyltransferase
MSNLPETCEAPSSPARAEAEDELRRRSYSLAADGAWVGRMGAGGHGDLDARVVLPPEFPQALPEVYVDRAGLPRRVPHVEKSGKVCIVPSTGVLLDARNPRGLVRDAVERARNVLVDGLSGANQDDFVEEFLAYWNADLEEGLVSICDPSGSSRSIDLLWLVRPGAAKDRLTLVADDLKSARTWTGKTGWRIGQRRDAFFMVVKKAFMPPDFDEVLSTSQMLDIILDRASPESRHSMRAWLRKNKLPATIIFSLPLKHGQGRALIGARLEAATGDARERAQKGFRPGHVPASLEMNHTRDAPVTRLQVGRLDPGYLITRGGSSHDMYSRTVTIIGCGAIGSHLAERLASLGIGHLKLVDPEELSADNVHRHVLGVCYIGTPKAEGMKATLDMKYPHIDSTFRVARAEELLETEPDFITGSDLVIVALGDETLELRLNDTLRDHVRRLHVWVEPLGIGGHVLATGLSGRGCFRCLFDDDPTHGIHNQSAFAAPGQKFQKTFSGCAGTFTPFAGVDADRAAVEAATMAARILRNDETENQLVSWRGYEDDFNRAGFSLSARGMMLRAGERRRETRFLRTDCPTCGTIGG